MFVNDDFWGKARRPQKDHTRGYVLHNLKWLAHSLWLPGRGSECVNAAYERGVLDTRSRIILAEQDKSLHPLIRNKIVDGRVWKDTPILAGKLSTIKLPWKLDFMWADFNGGFEQSTAIWFRDELRHKIAEGAIICVTHSYGWRNNMFLYQFREKMIDHLRRLRLELNIMDDILLTPILMMKCLLNNYSFRVSWPMKYRDRPTIAPGRTMVTYKFEDFAKLPNGETTDWPALVIQSQSITHEG
jgi:hypothetical protein